MPSSDQSLLRQFIRTRYTPAFDQLIERHAPRVHGSILRKVRNPALADDATQAVFLILAQKAATLADRPTLGGWLLKTASLAAADALRREARRHHHERRASRQRPEAAPPHPTDSDQLATLDDALASLTPADRDALHLRFYQDESFSDMAIALGTTEEAARKRTTRALDKLRRLLQRRGTTVTTLTLAALLAASAKSVSAASASFASTAARHSVAATSRSIAISQGVLHMLMIARLKLLAAVTAAGATIAATGVIIYAAATPTTAPDNSAAAPSATKPAADWRAGLPADLQTILAGWEDNTHRIKSVEAKGTMLSEGADFLEFVDRDGKRYGSQITTFSFYKQDDNLKFEVAHDREFGVDTNGQKRVQYSVPFGEYAFLKSGDDKKDAEKVDAIMAAYGVGGHTERTLIIGGKRYQHDVEENTAYIDPFNSNVLSYERALWPITGAYVDDMTLSERIKLTDHRLHSANASKMTYALTGPVDGIYTMTSSLTYSSGGKPAVGKNVIRIDSTKGYSVISSEGTTNGEIDGTTTFEYAYVNDCWVLIHADEKQFDANHRPGPTFHVVYTIDKKTLHVNEPIAEKTFELDSFLPTATWVANEVTHQKFYYKDIPAKIKLKALGLPGTPQSTPVMQSLTTQ